MQDEIKIYLLSQFSAAIKMLENAIDLCPQDVWNQKNDFFDFWYISYHTIFWLDFYLTPIPENFQPYLNFGLTELDPEGILPERVYSKDELKVYLEHCKEKSKSVILKLDKQVADNSYKFGTLEIPFYELILYNMRHIQHHTGQLNLILRQQINSAPKWVRRTLE